MNQPTNRIDFEEIEPCLNNLVGVWMSDINDRWFKRHWSILESANMTSYMDDIQKTYVYVNAVVLGVIWREFNHVLYDEGNEIELSFMIENIPFSDIRLGQIIRPDFEKEVSTDDEDQEIILRQTILTQLISNSRSQVINILRKHYGDDLSFFEGFTTFNVPDDKGATDKAVLNIDDTEELEHDDPQNMDLKGGLQEVAFSWISDGCPEIANIV